LVRERSPVRSGAAALDLGKTEDVQLNTDEALIEVISRMERRVTALEKICNPGRDKKIEQGIAARSQLIDLNHRIAALEEKLK
jgi:hypothetical protein